MRENLIKLKQTHPQIKIFFTKIGNFYSKIKFKRINSESCNISKFKNGITVTQLIISKKKQGIRIFAKIMCDILTLIPWHLPLEFKKVCKGFEVLNLNAHITSPRTPTGANFHASLKKKQLLSFFFQWNMNCTTCTDTIIFKQ